MIIGCGEATLTQTGSGIALLRERFKEQRSRMLTAEKRAQILPVWAGFASVIAIDFLTSNFWTALLIGACVGGSVVLARALDDAKQWIIRKTRTKVSAYEQIYQAHVRVDQVINADAPVDAEGSAIMGYPWMPKSPLDLVRVKVVVPAWTNRPTSIVAALFVNQPAVASKVASQELAPGVIGEAVLEFEMIPAGTEPILTNVRVGPGRPGAVYLNGNANGPDPDMPKPTLTIEEYRPFWR